AAAARFVVIHQHRHAVRVDAHQVGLDHHFGGGAHQVGVHAPGAEDRDDLRAHPLRGNVHSGRMFALLMISAHCADSARIHAPNSSGEFPTTSAPMSWTFRRIPSSFSTRTTSAWSCSRTSFGVPAGASRPNQLVSE